MKDNMNINVNGVSHVFHVNIICSHILLIGKKFYVAKYVKRHGTHEAGPQYDFVDCN